MNAAPASKRQILISITPLRVSNNGCQKIDRWSVAPKPLPALNKPTKMTFEQQTLHKMTVTVTESNGIKLTWKCGGSDRWGPFPNSQEL